VNRDRWMSERLDIAALVGAAAGIDGVDVTITKAEDRTGSGASPLSPTARSPGRSMPAQPQRSRAAGRWMSGALAASSSRLD
jgi:hypothetical protein